MPSQFHVNDKIWTSPCMTYSSTIPESQKHLSRLHPIIYRLQYWVTCSIPVDVWVMQCPRTMIILLADNCSGPSNKIGAGLESLWLTQLKCNVRIRNGKNSLCCVWVIFSCFFFQWNIVVGHATVRNKHKTVPPFKFLWCLDYVIFVLLKVNKGALDFCFWDVVAFLVSSHSFQQAKSAICIALSVLCTWKMSTT